MKASFSASPFQARSPPSSHSQPEHFGMPYMQEDVGLLDHKRQTKMKKTNKYYR